MEVNDGDIPDDESDEDNTAEVKALKVWRLLCPCFNNRLTKHSLCRPDDDIFMACWSQRNAGPLHPHHPRHLRGAVDLEHF